MNWKIFILTVLTGLFVINLAATLIPGTRQALASTASCGTECTGPNQFDIECGCSGESFTVLDRRYPGLKGLIVVDAEDHRIKRFLTDSGAEGLDFVSDTSGEIRKALGFALGGKSQGIILLDASGKIQFFAPRLLRNDYLRQLAEKHRSKKIDYSLRRDGFLERFQAGSPVGDLEVRTAHGNRPVKLDSRRLASSMIAVVPTSAPTCMMKGYREEVQELRWLAAEKKQDLYLLFGPQFSRQRIDFLVQEGELPKNTYMLPYDGSWFSAYVTRYPKDIPRMIAVFTDPESVIQKAVEIL